MDEKAHQLLGLRGGVRRFELAALEIYEHLTGQSYRIGWPLPVGGPHRSPFDHVEVLQGGARWDDGRGLARELHGVSQLLQQRELEAAQHRLDVAGCCGTGSETLSWCSRGKVREGSR